jgi:hypothetical protein
MVSLPKFAQESVSASRTGFLLEQFWISLVNEHVTSNPAPTMLEYLKILPLRPHLDLKF